MRKGMSRGTRFELVRGPYEIRSGQYQGCTEVHLGNFQSKEGGAGKSLAGGSGFYTRDNLTHISEWSRIWGRHCLVRGRSELYEIVGYYACTESMCLILKKTNQGFGRQWELYRFYDGKPGRKDRQRKKFQALADKYFRKWRERMRRLVG